MREISYSPELIAGQQPRIAVVICSDSRVCEYCETDFEFHPGEIFVVRNAGNSVVTCEGSVRYAIFHLHVKELHIIGHSDCGMMKALLAGNESDETIKKEMDKILNKIFDGKLPNKDVDELVIENVHRQIEYLLKDEKIRKLVEKGELVIKGFYYNFRNGKAEISVININGKKL